MRSLVTDRVWNDERRRMLIGLYFEGLIHTILGGNRKGLARQFKRVDMIHWVLDALVEVKAVDNGHRPTIFVDQFENHLKLAAFPLSHILYFVCCYKVKIKEDGKSRSELAEKTPTVKELERYLAGQTTEVFVIHHTLLQHIRSLGKHGRIRHRETIPVSRNEIWALTQTDLKSLNLHRSIMQVEKQFRGRRLRFKLVILCPRQITRRVRQLIRDHNRKEQK